MHWRSLPVVLALAALPLAAQSSYVALTGKLQAWKKEIEAKTGGKIIPVRVYTDPLRNEMQLPADTPERAVLREYFLQEAFRGQMAAAHGLTLNYSIAGKSLHFVLLNMARSADWGGSEEALLAEEFGHLWISALGYPAEQWNDGERSCISLHASDAVQHVLVRAELERRGFAWRDYWILDLDRAVAAMESQAPPTAKPRCQTLAQLALSIDVHLGLPGGTWKNQEKFETLLEKNAPEIAPYRREIEKELRALQAAGSAPPKEVYERALAVSVRKFTELYERR